MWSWIEQARARAVGAALGLAAVALLISALSGERGLLAVWKLEREVASAERMNFALVQKIAKLRGEVHALQTDDIALERAARRQAHLVRPGEVLYRLPPTNP